MAIFEFDSLIVSDLVFLRATYNTALQAAGNNMSAIPSATVLQLTTQIGTIINVVRPLVNSTDPAAAASATKLIDLLTIISNLLTGADNVYSQIQIVNPNLYALAAVYYGDASLWEVIAEASLTGPPGLTDLDPQPAPGLYTITIPLNNVPLPAPGLAFTS